MVKSCTFWFIVCTIQEVSATDQDKFVSLMSHAGRGRMDEQRCVLGSPRKPSTPVADSHSERRPSSVRKRRGDSSTQKSVEERDLKFKITFY